ncbi:MAG: elongation factor P-like protein EfpL [bacterium]
MPKASELKRGSVVEIGGVPHAVKKVESKSPSSRGAATLYKVRFTNLKTGQKLDESFKGDDLLPDADCVRVPVQYSYRDGDIFNFMNTDDYSQYGLNAEALGELTGFLYEGMEGITALLSEETILTIELPASVALTIEDTGPAVKGSTSTGRTKSAVLNTGLDIQVPEYLETGETIRVNTSTGKFLSRDT